MYNKNRNCETCKSKMAATGWLVFIMFVVGILVHKIAESAETIDAADYSWDAPTKRADGGPLPANEIKGYRFEWFGPNNTSGNFFTDKTSGKWVPPGVGQYQVQVRTIDTEDRMSDPSPKVSYTSKLVPISPPSAPALRLLSGEINYPVIVQAASYVNRTPSTNDKQWTLVDNALKAPGGARAADYTKNASVSFEVVTEGGIHNISAEVQAQDGLSDSLWIGPISEPIFVPNWNQWVWTNPVTLTLPAGKSIVTIYEREPNLLVRQIRATKK